MKEDFPLLLGQHLCVGLLVPEPLLCVNTLKILSTVKTHEFYVYSGLWKHKCAQQAVGNMAILNGKGGKYGGADKH